MNRFMRYSGSKLKFAPTFNEIVKEIDKKVYVEPFLGSGAVFCNLEKEYELYRLNDLNEHILSIWKFVKECTYNDFKDVLNEVNSFGSIKESKEDYYSYRAFYNENYHFTDKIEKGAYLYHLVNSTINSLSRFGPNGFNSSWGNCHYVMDKLTYDVIHNRLQRAELTSNNYLDVNYTEALTFLDPPYFERHSTYSKNFSSNDLDVFINFLKGINTYVYTDMLSEAHSKLCLKAYIIREMRNTTPGGKGEITGKEVYFTDIAVKNKMDMWS